MLCGGDMLIIVAYDIFMDENGAKILRNVLKICKKYLFRMQYSIFVGELSKQDIESLETELKKILRKSDKCDIMKIKNIKNLEHISLTASEQKINIL